jgi:hypothetical protein
MDNELDTKILLPINPNHDIDSSDDDTNHKKLDSNIEEIMNNDELEGEKINLDSTLVELESKLKPISKPELESKVELESKTELVESKPELESKTELESERLVSVNQEGQQVLNIKKKAVDSAKLSIKANKKSFGAGVRSAGNELNSIRVCFQEKKDYAVAVMQPRKLFKFAVDSSGRSAQATKQVLTFMLKTSSRNPKKYFYLI